MVMAVHTEVRGMPASLYWEDGDCWGDEALLRRLDLWIRAGWADVDQPETFLSTVRRLVGSNIVVATTTDGDRT